MGAFGWRFVNAASGLCMHLETAGSDGATSFLTQKACDGSANQMFEVGLDPSATYLVSPRFRGCLDVPGSIGDDGMYLQQFRCHFGPNQKW